MSTYPPTPQTSYPPSPYRPPAENSLGTAGFIVSLVGLIVCAGFLCPIGLVLSAIALGKEPRGLAIAGTIIGFIGSLLGVLIVLLALGVIGAGIGFLSMFASHSITYNNMYTASNEIDIYYSNNNSTLPDEPTGTSLISNYADEWGTAFKYDPNSQHGADYDLISAGPDMQFGTGDDIVDYFWVYSHTTQSHSGQHPNPVDATQIDFAFNQAAERMNTAFPAGTTLPNEADGNAQIAGLRDAWNQQIQYAPASAPMYHLKSAGPDQTWQTDDDLTRSFFFDPAGGQTP